MNIQQKTIQQKIEQSEKAYDDYLHELDDEQLAQEFDEQRGNECGEFEWTMFHHGRERVIEKLTEQFSLTLYEMSLTE